jgi:hypothetical protein
VGLDFWRGRFHKHAVLYQDLDPFSRNAGIGIQSAVDHTLDSGLYQSVGAWGCFSEMRTRFQRNVGSRFGQQRAKFGGKICQCDRFGVRQPGAGMKALRQEPFVGCSGTVDQATAYHWIWSGVPQSTHG